MQGIPYEGEEKILYNNDHSGPLSFCIDPHIARLRE
jgi:hypothetical protein